MGRRKSKCKVPETEKNMIFKPEKPSSVAAAKRAIMETETGQ